MGLGVRKGTGVTPKSSGVERKFWFCYWFHYEKDLGSHSIFMTMSKLSYHSVFSSEN